MQVPFSLKGEYLKHLLQGAAAGVVTMLVIGVAVSVWTASPDAARTAQQTAMLAEDAPVCVEEFQAGADGVLPLGEPARDPRRQGILQKDEDRSELTGEGSVEAPPHQPCVIAPGNKK